MSQEEREQASVFVRALDLPTASLKAAREAVRLQLDILSPLPPERTVAGLVALGPGEGGRTRFAVGLADVALFEEAGRPAAEGPAWIEVPGDLDGQELIFRFDNPHRALAARDGRDQLLRMAGVAGLCLVIVLGALSLRLGGDIQRLEARAEALQADIAAQARDRRAGRSAEGPRNAWVVSCAFEVLAAPGGPVRLTDLSVADGAAAGGFSQPLNSDQVQVLGARGVKAAPDEDTAGQQRRVVLEQAVCQ